MGIRMSDAHLRRLFSRLGDDATRRRPSCPDTKELVAYAERRLGGEQHARLESHLGGCAFCLGQVRFALRSEELGPPPAVPLRLFELVRGSSLSSRSDPRWRALGWLAAAAGVMFAVVAVRFGAFAPAPSSAGPEAPVSRPPAREVRAPVGLHGAAAPEIVQPRPGESIGRAALTVVWQPVSEALGYTVQVMDARGDLLWEDRTEALSTTVPAEVELAPGGEYFVWVTAELRSGLGVKSPAAAFRIAPE